MNALRAVPAPDGEPGDIARADLEPVDEATIDIGTADQPSIDPEALLLCALMWSAHTGECPPRISASLRS